MASPKHMLPASMIDNCNSRTWSTDVPVAASPCKLDLRLGFCLVATSLQIGQLRPSGLNGFTLLHCRLLEKPRQSQGVKNADDSRSCDS